MPIGKESPSIGLTAENRGIRARFSRKKLVYLKKSRSARFRQTETARNILARLGLRSR